MSVGSWILVASSGTGRRGPQALGTLQPLQRLAELGWFATGPPLATYTGALLANTAIPVWSEARGELPFVFGSSACASAGAAAAIFTAPASAGPPDAPRCSDLRSSSAWCIRWKSGSALSARSTGRASRQVRELSKGLVAAGAGLLALGGRRSRTAAVAGGSLVLAGELALRWSIFKAGFQSARDPKYTVVPQKARKARREAASEPGRRGPVHREQVDDEDERLVRLDHAAGAPRAVRHRRRDRQLAPAADLHPLHALSPSRGSPDPCRA